MKPTKGGIKAKAKAIFRFNQYPLSFFFMSFLFLPLITNPTHPINHREKSSIEYYKFKNKKYVYRYHYILSFFIKSFVLLLITKATTATAKKTTLLFKTSKNKAYKPTANKTLFVIVIGVLYQMVSFSKF